MCYLIFSYQYLKCRPHNASFAFKVIGLKKLTIIKLPDCLHCDNNNYTFPRRMNLCNKEQQTKAKSKTTVEMQPNIFFKDISCFLFFPGFLVKNDSQCRTKLISDNRYV